MTPSPSPPPRSPASRTSFSASSPGCRRFISTTRCSRSRPARTTCAPSAWRRAASSGPSSSSSKVRSRTSASTAMATGRLSATTRRPANPYTLNTWIDMLAPRAWAVVAAGTCATYGGIHAMAGNPTGAMGLADYLGWDFRAKSGLPIVNVPGCPVQPDNFMETLLWLLRQAAGKAAVIPLDDDHRPTWLFGKTVHEGCNRAGYYEQADFAHDYNSPKCQVKVGCWGPVVNCNVPKRGWMAGIGGCPNVGGICIGCTMPGFPDKFMPFMDQPPGASISAALIRPYGALHPRSARVHELDGEPRAEVAPQPQRADERVRPALVGLKGDSDCHGDDTQSRAQTGTRKLTEMNWDPITRIIGNLGIYTKIDFANREVVECKSTSSIFRGYSVFMKGKDPRDAHFITSRICGICGDNHATCSVYAQNMAYGIKMPSDGRAHLQPRRGGRVHVRPRHLPGQPGLRGLLREDGEGDEPLAAREGRAHAGAALGHPRSPYDRGHHAELQPVHRGDVPRGAADEPPDARDVLPDGRAPRAPVDALPRRYGDGGDTAGLHRLPRASHEVSRLLQEGDPAQRRHLRLLLRGACPATSRSATAAFCSAAGGASRTRTSSTTATRTWASGAARCTSLPASSSTESSSRRTSSTSTSASASCSATRTTRTGRRRRRSSRATRSATPSTSAIPGTRRPSPSRRSASSTAVRTAG